MSVAAIGCSGGTTYTVGGNSLKVDDQTYFSVAGHDYCMAAGAGQMKVVIGDYAPICGTASDDGGIAQDLLAHNQIEIVIISAGHGDPRVPYDVSEPDCMLGPAGPAFATFNHYLAATTAPQVTMAVGGDVYLDALVDGQPATGSFTLDFGTAGSIAGSFDAKACE